MQRHVKRGYSFSSLLRPAAQGLVMGTGGVGQGREMVNNSMVRTSGRYSSVTDCEPARRHIELEFE